MEGVGGFHVWKVWEGSCVEGVGGFMCGRCGRVHVWKVWEGSCVEGVGGCICGYHDNLTINSHDIMHQRVHWSMDI